MDQLEEKCYWNDVEYSTGDQVANDGNAMNLALAAGLKSKVDSN